MASLVWFVPDARAIVRHCSGGMATCIGRGNALDRRELSIRSNFERPVIFAEQHSQPIQGDQVSQRHRIAAIIVTYRPDIARLTALVDAVRPQVVTLIVVDNGSGQAVTSALGTLCGDGDAVLALEDNLGIAAAQNRGIARARALGCSAVLLLDQDSLPPPDMVEHLLSGLAAAQAAGLSVAAIGPALRDNRRPERAELVRRGKPVLAGRLIESDHIIASGSLVPLTSISLVGFKREDLFIDYVDIEWCLRAGTRGLHCYVVPATEMAHELGAPIRVLGRDFVSHNPMRHYYLFRNSVWLWTRRWVPLSWRLRHLTRLMLRLGFNIVFARPHRAQWAMMARGLRDGVLGRMGRGHD